MPIYQKAQLRTVFTIFALITALIVVTVIR